MKAIDSDNSHHFPDEGGYVVDKRPLCQGMRFVLTDAAHPRMVLKNGNHFLVLDQSAFIPACNTLGYGYYRNDTRYLSEWQFSLDGLPLSLLSSNVDEGFAGKFLYTNPQTSSLPQQKITVSREIVLSDWLWERFEIENFHNEPVSLELRMSFQSDFADMFEVRGLNLSDRGERMVPLFFRDQSTLFLAYRGLDDVLLETIIAPIGIKPSEVREAELLFRFELAVKASVSFQLCISTRVGGQDYPKQCDEKNFNSAFLIADRRCRAWFDGNAVISTDNEVFDMCLNRSLRDLYILRQPTPKGYGLAAGIPWYCAVFGRDSAITAMQVLPFLPTLARECINVLAAYQGRVEDEFRAESPGRILHELRLGELARTGVVPHSPYYGTVDATQLWLILLGNYVRWSGDLDLARQLWPAVKLAIQWLDRAQENGFLYYKRRSTVGLENQGWKDSGDSVMHRDGKLAEPPIAICEAQAYLFAAKRELSWLADLLGHKTLSARLLKQSEELRRDFDRAFWMEDEKFVALALDGTGKQTAVVSSNPGHCLFTGILDDEKAHLVADRLMSSDMDTGWGLRTLSSAEKAFNPISYHNGSVWPHDNAFIAMGMRKLGRVKDLHSIMSGLFQAAQSDNEMRLPELFCGFDRDERGKPISYPVSCSPQSWAAGSLFQLLNDCLNFQPDALNSCLRIVEAKLPDWLQTVNLQGLRVGSASVDLIFENAGDSTFCRVLRKEGKLRVIIES